MNEEIGLFTVYHFCGSAQRKAGRLRGRQTLDKTEDHVEGQDVSRAELLQVETTEQSLKARLRMEVRPDRVDLEINQGGFGPSVAILAAH